MFIGFFFLKNEMSSNVNGKKKPDHLESRIITDV
jgi:hypothetical protein